MHPFVQYTGAGSWFTFCTRPAMHYVFYAIHFIRYHDSKIDASSIINAACNFISNVRQCVRCTDGVYLRQLFHHSFSKYGARHKIDSAFVIFQMKSWKSCVRFLILFRETRRHFQNLSCCLMIFCICFSHIPLTICCFNDGSLLVLMHDVYFFLSLPFSISVTSVSLVESVLLAKLSCRSLYGHYQIALDDGHSSIVTVKLNPNRRNIFSVLFLLFFLLCYYMYHVMFVMSVKCKWIIFWMFQVFRV